METSKKVVVSVCCDSQVHYIPPSFGDPGFRFCSNCSTECESKIKIIETHREIQKGVFRPINNSNG